MEKITSLYHIENKTRSNYLDSLSVLLVDIDPDSCFLEFRASTFHHIIIYMFL